MSSNSDCWEEKRLKNLSVMLESASFSTVKMLCAQMYREKVRDSLFDIGNTKIIFLLRWLIPLLSKYCMNLSLSMLFKASQVVVS